VAVVAVEVAAVPRAHEETQEQQILQGNLQPPRVGQPELVQAPVVEAEAQREAERPQPVEAHVGAECN
jgi:hypothetical protein